jgi:hypothetical protein
MLRHTAAAAVVICLCPAWLFAQSTQLVVKGVSANVHKAPTTASPVIDIAPSGTALEVTGDLGSWVKVSWPKAPEGVGYVHESMVTTARPLARRGTQAGASSAGRAPAEPAAGGTSTYRQAIDAVAQHGTRGTATTLESAPEVGTADYSEPIGSYIRPPAHVIGFGGRMTGSTVGYGVSARAWPHRHLGFQVDMSRYALTNPALPERVTAMQFAPSAMFRLADRVTDYVWVRPYFGGGAMMHRQNYGAGVSDTTLGYQAFGGGEFTFASVPRFALSADAGYRWSRSPSPAFDFGGVAFSVAGHWYFR